MFKRTMLQLTLQYSALLLLLFALFSGGILLYMERTFGGDYVTETSASGTGAPEHAVKEAADAGLDRLRNILVISDLLVLVVVPAASYWLARRALKPVRVSYEMQQQFVDDASHELRTPLSIVQGELELALTKSRSRPEYRQAIATSAEEVSGLSKLVDSLLLIARNDPKHLEQTYELVNIGEILEDLAESAHLHNDSKSIILNHPDNLPPIKASRVLTARVLSNVIDNALKFTEKRGKIIIDVTSDKSFVYVAVQDDGIGMTTEQINQVFNRFWRAEEARSIKGHGLGLSLVKQMMTIQGGKISVESQPKNGTAVHLSFSR